MVKSWLLNSVSTQIYGSILSFDDATEIWTDLHNSFHEANLPCTFQLIQQIQDLCQGSLDLSSYYTLKTLWDNLDGTKSPEMCYAVTDLCLTANVKSKLKLSEAEPSNFWSV